MTNMAVSRGTIFCFDGSTTGFMFLAVEEWPVASSGGKTKTAFDFLVQKQG